jgi:hypothetical protein
VAYTAIPRPKTRLTTQFERRPELTGETSLVTNGVVANGVVANGTPAPATTTQPWYSTEALQEKTGIPLTRIPGWAWGLILVGGIGLGIWGTVRLIRGK